MTEEVRRVECRTHGDARPAFVCQHLFLQHRQKQYSAIGFFEPTQDPGDPDDDLEAWCGACDEVLGRVGEWNDESEAFADMKVLCSGCFQRVREIQHGFRQNTGGHH